MTDQENLRKWRNFLSSVKSQGYQTTAKKININRIDLKRKFLGADIARRLLEDLECEVVIEEPLNKNNITKWTNTAKKIRKEMKAKMKLESTKKVTWNKLSKNLARKEKVLNIESDLSETSSSDSEEETVVANSFQRHLKRKRSEKDKKYDLKRKKSNPSSTSNTKQHLITPKTETRDSQSDYEIVDKKSNDKRIIDSDDVTTDTKSENESSDNESTEEKQITESGEETTDDGFIEDKQYTEFEDEMSRNKSREENQTTGSEDNTSDNESSDENHTTESEDNTSDNESTDKTQTTESEIETSDNDLIAEKQDMGSKSIYSVEEFRSQKKMRKTDHIQYKDKETISENEQTDFKPAKKACALHTAEQANTRNMNIHHERYAHKQNKKTFNDGLIGILQTRKINSKNIFAHNNTTIVERKRQRYEHFPKPLKRKADIPVSSWSVRLLSEILVFKDTVVEMKDFDSQPNSLVKEIYDEIKPRLRLLEKATESGNSFFSKEISETEAGTTMILNEIFLLLCNKLKISMKRSESLNVLYMPHARFDYRFYNSEGKVIGIAEAKSINTLKPESVVQAIMQLLVTQCEVSNLFPDKTGTPLFNILTDGYDYVFIVLSKKKLAFEKYNDKIIVRTITNFSDLKIILNRLMSVVKRSL